MGLADWLLERMNMGKSSSIRISFPMIKRVRTWKTLTLGLFLVVPASADNWNTATTGIIASDAGTRIGIGTSAPASLNNRQQVLEISGAGVPTPTANQGLPGVVLRGGSYFTGNPAWEFGLAANGTNTDFLLLSGNSPRLYVNGAAGNIGIGTLTPTQRLEVAGGIQADGRLIANTASDQIMIQTDATGKTWRLGTGIGGAGARGRIGISLFGIRIGVMFSISTRRMEASA